MHACMHGHDDCARVLIDAGAAVNSVAPNTSTALELASTNGHLQTVRLLLHHGKRRIHAIGQLTAAHTLSSLAGASVRQCKALQVAKQPGKPVELADILQRAWQRELLASKAALHLPS